jgi:hypothetical protein
MVAGSMRKAFRIFYIFFLLLFTFWASYSGKQLLLIIPFLLVLYIDQRTTPEAAVLPTANSQWRYFGSHDYEREHPGIGTQHRYDKDDIKADLYVYDLKRNDWKEGIDDPQFFTHFMSTIDEIERQETTGIYKNIQFGETGRVEISGLIFLVAFLSYSLNGRRHDSAIAMTAHSGSLLKYRLSAPQPQADSIQTISIEFIEQNLKDFDVRTF